MKKLVCLLAAGFAFTLPAIAEPVALLVQDGLFVTMDPQATEPIQGWMAVGSDGRILSLEAGAPPAALQAAQVLNAKGKIVLPGFISAHSHLWSAPFRGIASESNLIGWIAEAHTPFSPYYQEDDFRYFTQYGALDFLSNGITTCYNWVSNNGYEYGHWMEQFEAHLENPLRFVFGWALDVSADKETNEKRLEVFLEEAPALMATNDHFLNFSLSALGLLRGDTEFPYWEGEWMERYRLDAQTHYLEEPSIKSRQQEEFAILEKSGMLCEHLHFAHFIHTTDEILEKTVAAGTRMVWNPLSNGRLASGLPDIPKYLDAGLRIGMGLDGQASGDLADPFENMRMGMYATRMKYESASIMSPYDVLAMHTLKSAEMLNVADRVGSLEVGKFADFLVLDPSHPDVGPIFDIYATIVLTLNTRNLQSVYVGGSLVYSDGEITVADFPSIRDEAHSRVDRMLGQLEADGKPVPGKTRLTKVVMQLDWIFNAQFAGVFQAESSGFFEEAGLDVEIRPKVQNQQTVAAVLEGDIIFGSAESNVLMLELEKGADIRAVATMFQDSPMAWMYKAEQEITRPADLIGKRVGIHPGDDHPLRYILRRNGLDPAGVEIKVVDYDLSALMADEVDVKQGYVIDEFVELNHLTGGKAGKIMGRDHGYLAYSQVVFTTPEVTENYPEIVDAFLRAMQRGWQKAVDHPEATVDLMIDHWNPELDRTHQIESLRLIAELVSPNGAIPLAPMSEERWKTSQQLFIEAGILSETIDLDDFLGSQWLP